MNDWNGVSREETNPIEVDFLNKNIKSYTSYTDVIDFDTDIWDIIQRHKIE